MSWSNWRLVGVAALATLTISGCGDRARKAADDAAGGVAVGEISATVRAALDQQRALLAGPSPKAPAAATVLRYFRLGNSLYDPALRRAATDTFFAVWEREPRQMLWTELSVLRSYHLQQKARRHALLAVAAGTDSTSARSHFVHARRVWVSRPAEAGVAFREAAARDDGADSLFTVWVRLRVAAFDGAEGAEERAIASIAQLIPLAWATGGPALAAVCWQDLAQLTHDSGRLDESLAAARMAETCARQARSGPQLVRARMALAEALTSRRAYAAAEAAYRECVATARDSTCHNLLNRSMMGLAALAQATGDLEREIAIIRDCAAMAEANRDTSAFVRLATAQSHVFQSRGDLDSAQVWLDRASVVNDHWRAGDERAYIDHIRAMLLMAQGRYAQAESLRLARSRGQDAMTSRADALELEINLIRQGIETDHAGLAYRALAKAESLATAGVQVSASYDPILHLGLASAHLHARQGEFELADAALVAIAPRTEQATAETRWYVAETRTEVAGEAGDLLLALAEARRGAELAAAVGLKDMLRRSRVLEGSALLTLGRAAAAESLMAADVDAPEFWTRFNARLMTGMAQARLGKPVLALTTLAGAETLLGPDAPPDLAARLALERGRVLLSQGRAEAAGLQLAVARAALAQGPATGGSEIGESFNAEIKREVAEAQLSCLWTQTGGRDHAGAAAESRDIAAWGRGRLPGVVGGPYLGFFVGPARAYAWSAGADGRARWTDLGATDELRRLVEAVITDTGYPDRDVDVNALAELGRRLLTPVASLCPAGATLAIAPDGFLHSLPWAALPWPPVTAASGTTTLLDHGPFVLLVGAQKTPSGRSHGDGLLAIGANGGADRDGRRLDLAESEAREIAAMWTTGPVELRVGAGASVAALRGGTTTNRRAIHISSHAKVFEGRAGRSAIHLAGEGDVPLTPAELASGTIGADLVYLSSCEGARRYRHPGFGVVSFAGAFLDAGAGAVVASSVLVDDAVARATATAFYRAWLAGEPTPAALRTALLAVRRAEARWRHPFYWAYFALYR